MYQKIADGFQLSNTSHPFIFKNKKGHVVKIIVIAANVVRVQFLTEAAATEETYNTNSNTDASIQDKGDQIEFETPALRIVVVLEPAFQIKWYRKGQSEPFAEDLAYRSYGYDADTKWHYQRKHKDVLYYGLGERTGNLNLSNRRFRLDRLDCMGYDAETQDPLYKFCPFYIGLSNQSKQAYGIYYNNFSRTVVDLGQELDAIWGPYTYYQCETGPLDYYMIDGPSVSNVTTAYLQITGAQPRHLPPRYSFGYLASSMGYAEAHDAQAQIEGFVEKCREHNIPCDGMHLSSGYTLNKQGERCVFTWNKDRFPDPEKMAKTLHDAGIRIFANIKPWLLQESHPDFKDVESKKGLIWGEDGPGQVMQWRGGRHTMALASYVDFTSEAGYQYWKSHVKSQLLEKGYGLWLDNNEFVIQDESYTFACEKPPDQYHRLLPNDSFIHGPVVPTTRTSAAVAGTALQTLLMVQASYEAVREHQPLQRPFLITRSATPYCSQLVSQTWSGDNTTAWKTIKYNIPMGISAGLCGMPAAYGHDIGGFDGDKPGPEMLVRWVQQGVFWPRFSIHSYNTDDTVTEPWMYEEVLPTIRNALKFRYRLIPYIYTLYVQHVYYGTAPLIRPVFYDHQHDTTTYTQQFEFMLGPSVLVAPIYESNLTKRSVYLPSDTAWYHYQSGAYYEGGTTVQVSSQLTDDACPFFVKAGSMLCFGKDMQHVHESDDDERRIQIFPERGTNERRTFRLFEDDGDTLYHESGGAFAEIEIWMETNEREIHVGLDIVRDGFFPYYSTVWVTCPIESETRKLVFEQEPELRMVDDESMYAYVGLKLPLCKTQ